MALTVKKMSPAKTIVTGGQNGYREQHGIIQFTGTDLTGELPVQLRQIEAVSLESINAYTDSVLTVSASISATGTVNVTLPSCAGQVIGAKLKSTASVTTSDTNYWTFSIANTSNSSVAVLATDNLNTTKATGGAAIVANTDRALVLNATAANLAVKTGDVLAFTATKTASATTLTVVTLELLIRADDSVSLNEDVSDGVILVPGSTGTVTVNRYSTTPASGLLVSVVLKGI